MINSNFGEEESTARDRNTDYNFKTSDVIGSLRYGRWDRQGIWLNSLLVAGGAFMLLWGGLLAPLLYVNQLLTILQFIVMLVILAPLGLFCIICSVVCLVKMKKGKALLYLCIEDRDLHRSRAQVIVTTGSSYVGRSRSPAIITLRFKVNGKKYEKRNLKNITYVEKYYYIDILYSSKHDEVFLLKMN